MKKLATLLLAFVLVMTAVVGCGKKSETKTDSDDKNTVVDQPTTDPVEDQKDDQPTDVTPVDEDVKSEGVMTYDEYVAAAIDDEVVIETYVQAKQSWWDNKATLYTQDKDGAYFIYNAACSEEDYAKLVPGTKIKVTGFKAEWAGEVEVGEGATIEILEGSYIASATDVTAKLADEAELVKSQNQFVSFTDMTVEARADGAAYNYKWDNSGADGDDLYFNVSKDGVVYTFTVESYLCDNTTDVYAAVKNLKVGQTISMEGFLYWYNGVNPHITAITAVADDAKSEGVMTYAEYMAAEIDDEVVIETYVQAKQSWWDNKATLYTQDKDGAYFIYNMACSEEDYAKLVPGTKIKVTGFKAEWAGEIEIAEGATFEIIDGNYIAPAVDVTAYLANEDELVKCQNRRVSFKGLEVAARDDGAAFNYKWDNSGADGDDLYFNVTLDGAVYTFTVESYLCDNTTDVYAAVKALEVGQTVDMEGFLYWYNGVNPHITAVTVK